MTVSPDTRIQNTHEPSAPGEVDRAGGGVSGEQASHLTRLESRSDLATLADAAYRSHAIEEGCDRVRNTEGIMVTPAMREIEAKDADRRLIGLEFRLKGVERLTEKVANAVAERTHERPWGGSVAPIYTEYAY